MQYYAERESKSNIKHKCALCGKRLYPYQYNMSEYAYRKGADYYCSYSHYREGTKKNRQIKV